MKCHVDALALVEGGGVQGEIFSLEQILFLIFSLIGAFSLEFFSSFLKKKNSKAY